MIPKKIAVKNMNRLQIVWDDGTECSVALEYLREQCPCAVCKGEPKMLSKNEKKTKNFLTVNSSAITNIKIVGTYAALIIWKDGHDKGLYTWDFLKQLAQNEFQKSNFEYQPLI